MFDGGPYRDELRIRIATIRRLLDEADPITASPVGTGVGREVRGLSVLLLFALYENLLRSLCRGILETAIKLRVGNKRIRTGIRVFAVHNLLASVSDSSTSRIWRESGLKLLKCAEETRICTINANVFPDDGSFMKRTQVKLFFELFELGDPGSILKEVWVNLDTIVTERNNIAHGKKVPEEVGRSYSPSEIRDVVNLWEKRWIEVIDHIEARCSTREFYRP